MTTPQFPDLDANAIVDTRDAIHAYAQVLGDWRASCLAHRKHWWEITVYPSIRGLSTGMVRANIDFELELDLTTSQLRGRVAGGEAMSEPLAGRSARELAEVVESFLVDNGIDRKVIPADKNRENHARATAGYSTEIAQDLAGALRSVGAALTELRAGISEETSPIHIWPHHFDLAMLWLPGEKIPGQDPDDEEASDKQMSFGFTMGDEGIPEPYFYISAYPLPEAFPALALPRGTRWHTEGFSGVVLLYRSLLEEASPHDYLVSLWNSLLSAGRQHMLTNNA
jgi:hypothetical protein